MTYNYSGIILGKYDIGESDRIYTLYTLEMGKIRTVAKGVRKSQAKLAGHLENFTWSHISVAKSRGMGKITGAVAEEIFSGLRKNLDFISEVFYAAGILNKLAKEEEKDERIFILFLEYLKAMEDESESAENSVMAKLLTQGFIFNLFDCFGYKIEARVCVECGQPLSLKGNYFNSEKGGFLCPDCTLKLGKNIKANPNAIKIIRIFYHNSLKSLTKLKVSPSEINNLKIISREFFRWIA